ncbi:MAG: putative rane-bound serine protease [Chlamydiales bacterium]|jgi:membrane-bound serine protease (ClpP class)|nr:putative rane-bound serine protease [Chlamydiales bacterium]
MFNALMTLLGALLCVFIEFYVPGGVFGFIGGVIYITSFGIAYYQVQSGMEFLVFCIIAIASGIGIIKLALWNIKHRKEKNTIYLEADQEGYKASTYPIELIGASGIALCDLRPAGYIEVNGKKISAITISGYIEQGKAVLVIGGEGSNLIVKTLEKDEK